MSARRWLVRATLAACVLVAPSGVARAQSVVVRAGGQIAGSVGQYIDVPITVDMTGAPALRLGSYRAVLQFDPAALNYYSANNGTFAQPLVNDDSANSAGKLRFTAVLPAGATGVVTLFVVRFSVSSATPSPLDLSFDEMSAAGMPFTNLLPSLTVQNGSFCPADGIWGDVDLDGLVNSRDALIALSRVVGIELDTVTVLRRPGLADVDGDGNVTSRDALIIVSHAVGLPVPGFRIGLPAAGACTAGAGLTLRIAPDTVDLQTGQEISVVVTARDGSGRAVSTTGARWTSDSTAVAAAVMGSGGQFIVQARGAGTARVTAELGGGLRASAVVRVVAHRKHWYVAVQRAREASLQVGSQALPYDFIGKALELAQDGDTIHVASGIYEEVVSREVSVAIIGDAANRPVIDVRFSPSYASSPLVTQAVQLGSRPGLVTLENLRIVGGSVFVGAHDLAVRNVRIDAPLARDVFIFVGPMGSPGAAPPALLRPVAADVPIERAGKALIDGLYVAGYQETGIDAFYADSVIVRNSSAIRDAPGTAANCYPTSMQFAGIFVGSGSSAEIRDNTVTNAQCTAIRVGSAQGRAVISRNRVLGARAAGIVVAADTVALDHNVVRDVLDGNYGESVGIGVALDAPVRRLTSLGDSVINVGQRGFAVDSTLVGAIDSLVVDRTGQAVESSGSPGVDLRGGHYTLRDSRIGNTQGGVGVLVTGSSISLDSRRNVIENTGAEGIYAFDPCYSGCLTGAPVLGRSPPSATQSSIVADTLLSVSDTLRGTGGTAIVFGTSAYALVDMADVDGVVDGAGVEVFGLRTAIVRRTSIRNTGGIMYGNGVTVQNVDTVVIDRVAVSNAAVDGVYLEGIGVAAKVYGSTVDNSYNGVRFFNSGTAPLAVDSSRFAGSAEYGIHLQCASCAALGAITRSSITGNAGGLYVEGASGGPVTLEVHQNTIAGNTLGGVWNQAETYGVTVAADNNYWGDPKGPRCNTSPLVTGCDAGSTAGDRIMTLGVTFTPYLAGAHPGVMTAPPTTVSAASRPDTIRAGLEGRPAANRASVARPHPVPQPRVTRAAAPSESAAARGRDQLARPTQPWQRGRPSNQPAPRHN